MDARETRIARNFGIRLRRLAHRRRWSLEDVARAVGLHRNSVSRHYNGSQMPSLGDCVAYADAFQVTLDSLCDRSPDALEHAGRTGNVFVVDENSIERLRAASTQKSGAETVGDLWQEGWAWGVTITPEHKIVSESEYEMIEGAMKKALRNLKPPR